MKKSEAISLLMNLFEKIENKQPESHFESANFSLKYLLAMGFIIPCNKRGKFEWEPEDETK